MYTMLYGAFFPSYPGNLSKDIILTEARVLSYDYISWALDMERAKVLNTF